MENVKVLGISWNDISSLPQSFQLLTKLRMLDLRGNTSLYEISVLGELKDLEILVLNETGITEIPKEIAQLVNLRVLHIKDCADLSCITPGAISALWRLEELSIKFNSKFKGAFDCIVEVMSLSKLTHFYLTVPNIDDFPAQVQGFNSEKLNGFVIQIGEYIRYGSRRKISRSDGHLVLSTVHLRIPLLKWVKKLIAVSHPHIFLSEIDSLKNMIPTLYDEGFNKLEHIELYMCSNVSCLVDDGTRGSDLGWDDENVNVIVFPSLATIYFDGLPRLRRFLNSAGNCSIKYPSLVELGIHNCDSMKIWGPGIHEMPNLKTLGGNYNKLIVPLDGPCGINEAVEKLWRKWKQVDDNDDDDDE